jgi:membrane-associated phospholipid phosphatase
LLIGMMHRPDRLRELFWIMFIAGIVTDTVSVLLPALGTFDAFGHPKQADYLVDMGILRGGGALNFELGKLTGIISFPSFHTTMALVYAFCFRGSGPVGYFIVLLNFLMLPTIPFVGGHYLTDMIGGAAVAAMALPAGIWVSKLDWVSNREKITAGLPRPSAG